VDAAAVLNDDGSLTVFAVNRMLNEDVCLDVDVRSFGAFNHMEQSVLHHEDLKAVNTEQNPDNVCPAQLSAQPVEGGKLEIRLGAASWNVIRLVK